MKSSLTTVALALLSTAFLVTCQDVGSGPVGPDGLVPQFAKVKNCDPPKPHPSCSDGDDGGGSGTTAAAVTLGIGMEADGLDVTGKNDDSLVRLSTGAGDFSKTLTWAFSPDPCVPVVGANGSRGAELVGGQEGAEMALLLAQLEITDLGSGSFFLEIDKTAFVNMEATDQLLLWEYDYVAENEDDPFQGVGFRIQFDTFFSESDAVKVKRTGPDKFEFTGPIMVAAFNMGGRSGKRGRRAISCGGEGEAVNLVTVTVFPPSS